MSFSFTFCSYQVVLARFLKQERQPLHAEHHVAERHWRAMRVLSHAG